MGVAREAGRGTKIKSGLRIGGGELEPGLIGLGTVGGVPGAGVSRPGTSRDTPTSGWGPGGQEEFLDDERRLGDGHFTDTTTF